MLENSFYTYIHLYNWLNVLGTKSNNFWKKLLKHHLAFELLKWKYFFQQNFVTKKDFWSLIKWNFLVNYKLKTFYGAMTDKDERNRNCYDFSTFYVSEILKKVGIQWCHVLWHNPINETLKGGTGLLESLEKLVHRWRTVTKLYQNFCLQSKHLKKLSVTE